MESESYLMKLSVFIKNQVEGPKPFLCVDKDHAMPLVPFMTEELNVELRCFVPKCDFKISPGLDTYDKILKDLANV